MASHSSGRADLAVIGLKSRSHGRGPDDRRRLGEQLLQLRNEGVPLYLAAERVGLAEATARRYVRVALAARIPPTVDEYRRQGNDRLDMTQRAIVEQIDLAERLAKLAMDSGNVPGIVSAGNMRAQALQLQLRLEERRARLNGMDAPIVVQATVEHTDPRDAELADLVARAKAKMEEASDA